MRPTCKGKAGLAAYDGPKWIGGKALVGPRVLVFVQLGDAEVSTKEGVAWIKCWINAGAVELPPKWQRPNNSIGSYVHTDKGFALILLTVEN